MRRALLALVLLAACAPPRPDIGLKHHGSPAHSTPMKVACDPLGTAVLDPIGNAMHLHLFFGNRDLFGGQGTSCGDPNDTAHYWVPALVYKATGQPVPVQGFFAYYRAADGQPVGQAIALPHDARIVAGDKMNMAPLDTSKFSWSCDQRSSKQGAFGDIPSAACNTAHGTVFLTAKVNFPTCWNGRLTGTNDTPNFAYYDRGCPSGFPIETVQLRETIKWQYRGDGSDVALSSDLMIGAISGRTLHGDFWNTWDQSGFESFVRECVNSRC